ncbi:MAG: hypothetical protein LAN36_01835 [Acidobacteriia bacterium]|nr:hypothetical protein [Terriglobia bacterium]
MANEKSLERLVSLLERQIAIQLYLGGANQGVIARMLNKSKGWVNDLLRGLPRNKVAK